VIQRTKKIDPENQVFSNIAIARQHDAQKNLKSQS